MTITQLYYVLAVAENQNFTKAAEKCFVTQPTLSMQIQKLEDELDILIFDRSKKPIELTDVGRKIVNQAKNIVNESSRIQDIVDRIDDVIDLLPITDTGAFSAVTYAATDTNGDTGLSHPNGAVTATVSGDTLTYTVAGDGVFTLTRVG